MSRRKRSENRIALNQTELRHALRERLDILLNHTAAFDKRAIHFGKEIAADLQILLWESLRYLGRLNQMEFYDSSRPFRPDNVFPHHGLVAVGRGCVFPAFDDGAPNPRPFKSWRTWSKAIVMSSLDGPTFSRLRLVKDYRNLEGSHEDRELPPEYHSLTRGIRLGYEFTKDEGLGLPFRPDGVPPAVTPSDALLPNPLPAAVRQIAHELLVSLATSDPDAFASPRIVERLLRHHPAPFGIRGMYRKGIPGKPSSEPISVEFNHPLDPAQFLPGRPPIFSVKRIPTSSRQARPVDVGTP
jgi:hypothetical protein